VTASQRPARRPPRRRRGRAILGWGLRAAVVAAVFGVGVALGRALEEGDRPASTQTLVRTLDPLPLAPARVTVTVTTTTP
jgi:hypothetical protein